MPPLLVIAAEKKDELKAAVRRFSFWRYLEPVFEHFLYPFYRTSSKSSFGKLWASLLLFTCMHFWLVTRTAVPDTLVAMVQTMLVYVFVTKPVQIARDHVERKDVTKQAKPNKSAEEAL